MELLNPIVIMRWMCFFTRFRRLFTLSWKKAGKLLNIEMKKSCFFLFLVATVKMSTCLVEQEEAEGAVRVVRFHHCPEVQLSATTSSKRPSESEQVKK